MTYDFNLEHDMDIKPIAKSEARLSVLCKCSRGIYTDGRGVLFGEVERIRRTA